MATVRQVIDNLTGQTLNGHTTPVVEPGWSAADSYPVRDCLLCILNEEWHHRLYAERDLDTLESRRESRQEAGSSHPHRDGAFGTPSPTARSHCSPTAVGCR